MPTGYRVILDRGNETQKYEIVAASSFVAALREALTEAAASDFAPDRVVIEAFTVPRTRRVDGFD